MSQAKDFVDLERKLQKLAKDLWAKHPNNPRNKRKERKPHGPIHPPTRPSCLLGADRMESPQRHAGAY